MCLHSFRRVICHAYLLGNIQPAIQYDQFVIQLISLLSSDSVIHFFSPSFFTVELVQIVFSCNFFHFPMFIVSFTPPTNGTNDNVIEERENDTIVMATMNDRLINSSLQTAKQLEHEEEKKTISMAKVVYAYTKLICRLFKFVNYKIYVNATRREEKQNLSNWKLDISPIFVSFSPSIIDIDSIWMANQSFLLFVETYTVHTVQNTTVDLSSTNFSIVSMSTVFARVAAECFQEISKDSIKMIDRLHYRSCYIVDVAFQALTRLRYTGATKKNIETITHVSSVLLSSC